MCPLHSRTHAAGQYSGCNTPKNTTICTPFRPPPAASALQCAAGALQQPLPPAGGVCSGAFVLQTMRGPTTSCSAKATHTRHPHPVHYHLQAQHAAATARTSGPPGTGMELTRRCLAGGSPAVAGCPTAPCRLTQHWRRPVVLPAAAEAAAAAGADQRGGPPSTSGSDSGAGRGADSALQPRPRPQARKQPQLPAAPGSASGGERKVRRWNRPPQQRAAEAEAQEAAARAAAGSQGPGNDVDDEDEDDAEFAGMTEEEIERLVFASSSGAATLLLDTSPSSPEGGGGGQFGRGSSCGGGGCPSAASS